MNMGNSNLNEPNWNDLRFFLAAAEAGSLSAAARLLGSNQPTVGRHIGALENDLGVKLFQRHPNGLVLSQEGAAVLEQVQLMQNGVQGIRRLIEGDYAELRGSVRMALPEGLCNALVVPRLVDFQRRYPDLALILNVSASSANLTRGEADVALRLYRPDEDDLVVRGLGSMEMGLYASREYLARQGTPDETGELADHRLIGYGDALERMPEQQWLLQHAPRERPFTLRSDSTSARLRATACGLGLSIQPCLIAETDPALVRVLPGACIPSHEIWLAFHRDLRHVLRVRVVVDFVGGLFG